MELLLAANRPRLPPFDTSVHCQCGTERTFSTHVYICVPQYYIMLDIEKGSTGTHIYLLTWNTCPPLTPCRISTHRYSHHHVSVYIQNHINAHKTATAQHQSYTLVSTLIHTCIHTDRHTTGGSCQGGQIIMGHDIEGLWYPLLHGGRGRRGAIGRVVDDVVARLTDDRAAVGGDGFLKLAGLAHEDRVWVPQRTWQRMRRIYACERGLGRTVMCVCMPWSCGRREIHASTFRHPSAGPGENISMRVCLHAHKCAVSSTRSSATAAHRQYKYTRGDALKLAVREKGGQIDGNGEREGKTRGFGLSHRYICESSQHPMGTLCRSCTRPRIERHDFKNREQ